VPAHLVGLGALAGAIRAADEKLSELAEGGINHEAADEAHPGGEAGVATAGAAGRSASKTRRR